MQFGERVKKLLLKPKNDPWLRLKEIAYSYAIGGIKYTHEELLAKAKFYLAYKTNTLLKDPIWDEYTEPELIVEYLAHRFGDDEDFRNKYEIENSLGKDNMDDFLDFVEKNSQKEQEDRMNKLEDSIKFNPIDVIGE